MVTWSGGGYGKQTAHGYFAQVMELKQNDASPLPPGTEPMPAPGRRLAERIRLSHSQVVVLAALLLFVVVRVFSGSAYFDLGGDQCKYLTLGRSFPRHTLFNHSLYLLHPPPFGLSIGLFAFAMPLLDAGLFASLLWAVLTFWAVRRYGQLHGLTSSGLVLMLLYLSVFRGAVIFDSHVSRMPILQFFTVLSLLTFERFLCDGTRRRLLWAVLANACCLSVSDQALALLPAQLIVFLIDRRRGRWPELLLLLSASGAIYLIWPAVRLAVYLTHAHYPAGMDGMVEHLSGFPLIGTIQPNYLPTVLAYHLSTGTNMDFALGAADLVRALSAPAALLLVNRAVGAILVAGLLLGSVIVGRLRRDLSVVKLLALSLLFFLPILLQMPYWYGLGFALPFSVLLGKSFACIEPDSVWDRRVASALAIGCIGVSVGWLLSTHTGPASWREPAGGAQSIFGREPVTRGQQALRWIRDRDGDLGTMAPVGLTPEVAYLTGKRVVALPFDPEQLAELTRDYDIDLLVLTDREMAPLQGNSRDWAMHRFVARHILQNPERYRFLNGYEETYPAFYPPQSFLFFEVAR